MRKNHQEIMGRRSHDTSNGTAVELTMRSFSLNVLLSFAHVSVVKGTHRSKKLFDAAMEQKKREMASVRRKEQGERDKAQAKLPCCIGVARILQWKEVLNAQL